MNGDWPSRRSVLQAGSGLAASLFGGCLRLTDADEAGTPGDASGAGPTDTDRPEPAETTTDGTDTATREHSEAATTEEGTESTDVPEPETATPATDPTRVSRQFHYDRANAGRLPAGLGPTGDVEVRWSVDAGAGGPAVTEEMIVAGAGNGIAAFDPEDGSRLWEQEVSFGIDQGPAVIDGTVYAGGYDDAVYALDAATGDVEWRVDVGDRACTPTVADGTVYVGSFDGTLYALSASDGSEEWTFTVGREIRSAPAVADGSVYVRTMGAEMENVFSLDAADGSREWARETAYQVDNAPVVVDGTVYVGSESLLALDVETGTERWAFDAGGTGSTPAVAAGTVYVGQWGPTVYAVSAENGRSEWTYRADDRVFGAPVVAGNTVYAGDEAGTVHAIATENGTDRWTFEAEGEIESAPVVVGGTLYVSDGETLYALADG